MTTEGLAYISSCMDALEIPYGLMRWLDPVELPFWVGDYTTVENPNEDGLDESTFMLTGMAESYIELEQTKETIKGYFTQEGRTEILDSGSGIAVSYSGSTPLESGRQGLYRLQVNLNIKEWRC